MTNLQQFQKFIKGKYYDVIIHTAVSAERIIGSQSKQTVYDNLAMLYNILINKKHFGKLIQFGSGAQLRNYSKVPYDMSKRAQMDILYSVQDAYHLRIYNIFNYNQVQDRFIRKSIQNYIDKKPIVIHQDRYFDFFYMKDFIKVVDYYVFQQGQIYPKYLDFCYEEKLTLMTIASIINGLDNYKVDIILQDIQFGLPYIGVSKPLYDLDINLGNLESAIRQVYNKLKENTK